MQGADGKPDLIAANGCANIGGGFCSGEGAVGVLMGNGDGTFQEALTLASIVEKETGTAADRGKVAGVFVNRLRLGMPLQTDPTVIFGLGAAFDGNLRKRDLLADGPYNTYTRAGLPPTPIAVPGKASLVAAVRPDATKALFFVARGVRQSAPRPASLEIVESGFHAPDALPADTTESTRTRLAEECRDAACPLLHRCLERLQQLRELERAADDRRLEAPREPRHVGRDVDDPKRRDRLRLSLELERRQLLDCDRVADEPVRGRADHDLARLGPRFQASGNVDHVAGG